MHIDPRDAADLHWYFNLADAEIGKIPSTFPQPRFHEPVLNVRELRCGPIEVHIKHEPATYEMDLRTVQLVSRWRRIKRAIDAAGPAVAEILRLRFREPLQIERVAFDMGGKDLLRRLDRRAPGALKAEFASLRGAGAVAHLTTTAIAEHRRSRSTRELGKWLDHQGRSILASKSSPSHVLQRAETIRREAEGLVAQAVRTYRGEWFRAGDRPDPVQLAV